MDLEQLEKRVQWLDDERRKDKNKISLLEEHILTLDGKLAASDKTTSELNGEITRLKTIISRMDNYDDSLVMHRKELTKQIQTLEKQFEQSNDEMMSVLRAEIRSYDSQIFEIRKGLMTFAQGRGTLHRAP